MLRPGAGVGGHCIPKDPWLFISGTENMFQARIIPAARGINDSMPVHVANLAIAAMLEAGIPRGSGRVAVLGYAYMENSDDSRNSPSTTLVKTLQQKGFSVVIHDPWVKPFNGNIYDLFPGCDAVILMVAHDEYKSLDWREVRRLVRTPIVVDGRGVLAPDELEELGITYRGVGRIFHSSAMQTPQPA